MTPEVIKGIPEMVERPIVVMQSKTKLDSITILGELRAENGNPVLAAMKLTTNKPNNTVKEFQVITSAYGKKNNNIQGLLNTSNILFIEPNKKRTDAWLSSLRVQFPSDVTTYGSINNITYFDEGSNNSSKNDTVARAFEKAEEKKTKEGKYSLKDSEGRTLSQGQLEFFKDSKVRDGDGNLLVMYHGTPEAGFTEFKEGTYFTQNKAYADVYQSPGASSLSVKKSAENPGTYKVYLNIKKPFDTRNGKERDIFENEYYRQWGTGAPLMESGLPDWTDGMDLQEFIEEMGYDYDGLILDEGGTGGYDEEVQSRGLSYIAFSPKQVKNIDNLNPTENPDIRYQLKDQDIKEFDMTKKQVVDNMKSVASMSPVAVLTGNEFAKSSTDLVTQVSDYFNEIGNVATNSVLGEVALNRKGVKVSVGHGIGRLKAVAFRSVPEVISNGQIIDAQRDWKGRGYDTVVVAAPVKIGDSDYYVGAIIERQSKAYQEYYLHEVAVIEKNSMPKTGTLARNPGSITAPIYNLLQQLNNVNNLTEKDVVSDEGRFQLKDQELKEFNMTKKQVMDNMKSVANMKPVKSVSNGEFNEEGKAFTKQVQEFFESVGKVENEMIGGIELTKRGIKESWGHKGNYGKVDAFKAVPEIIKNGKVIDAQKDWKGRGYNTVVIAAPITIENTPYFAAVVVKRIKSNNVQRYYLHDVLAIKKGQYAKAQAVERTPDSITAPIYNLLHQLNNVNNLTEKDVVSDEGKFQLKEQELKPFQMDKKQILSNLQNVTKMDSVCSLDGTGFEKQEGRSLSQAVMDYYGGEEFIVHNASIGDVKVGKRGIKADTQHKPLYGAKIKSFKALKEVIGEGKVINASKRYEGKNYDRLIVAAPIEIEGISYYMGVVINRDKAINSQTYYIHDVILTEKNNSPLKDTAELIKSRPRVGEVVSENSLPLKDTETQTGITRVGETVSPYIILQQLNNINNLTEKDIISDEGRFQLKDENESLRKQLSVEKELSKKLKVEFKRSKYATPDPKQTGKAVTRLIEAYLGRRDAVLHQSIMQDIDQVYREMRRTEGNWNLVDDLCRNVADKIVSNMEILHDEMWTQYSDLRESLRKTTLKLSESEWNNIADFEDLRKSHFGTVRLSKKNGVPIDTFYQELSETYPELFDAQEYTNEVDQLYNVLDVVDGMKPYAEDYSSGEIAEFADNIAKDVLQMSYDLAQKKTFADLKYEEKMKAVEKVKAERNAKMKAQKERYEKRLERQAGEYKQKEADRRQRRQDEALRNKLLQLTRRLKRVKTDKATREYIDSLIGEIDTVAKGMRDGTRLNLEQLRDQYEKLKANDPDFISNKDIDTRIGRLDRKQIRDMDIADVRELVELMSTVEHGIRVSKRLIEAEDRREVRRIAEETVTRMEKVEGSKAKGPGSVYDKYISSSLSPLREFRRLMGYDEKSPLYKSAVAINEGQRKMNDFVMRSSKLFDKFTGNRKWIRKFTGSHADIITKQLGSKTVKYTPAMRVSLYLHSLNDQNLKHIAIGGVKIPEWNLYKSGKISEAYARGERVVLSPSEVRKITSEMTAQEKAFAEQAKTFFNKMSQSAINETSLALEGIEKAIVDDYFPIVSDKRFTKNNIEALIKDGTIEGMGMLKERNYAGNPIVLEDVTNVVNRQIQNVGKYYGLAIPIRNFNKLYNQSVMEFHDDGSYSYQGSVKESLESKWGGKATMYIENLLTDMQNGRQTDNTWLDRARGSYAQAVLALNVSVTMKQAASYPTAAAVLGYGPLVKAMAHPGRLNHTVVDHYTPLLWYRSRGYRDTEMGDIVSRGSLNSKAPAIMGWIQKVDMMTVGKLWKASEIYVKDNYKNLEYRSDLFYKKTAEIFNRVTEETQPNYTVMQRPDILRTTNQGLRAITMFSTQRMQNFNILYDSLGNLKAKRKAYKEIKSTENRQNLRTAKKEVVKSSTSQLIAAGTIVAMTFIAAAALHGLKRYDDDDDGEITLEEILGGISDGFLDTIAGTFLFGSDVYSLVNSLVTGDTYYGINNASLELINDASDSVLNLKKQLEKALNGEASVKSVVFQSKEFAKTFSKLLGIPLENAEKIILSPMRYILEKRYGKYVAEYMELQWRYDESEDSDDAKSKFGAIYRKALKAGEMEQAYTIRSMMEEGGLDKKYINSRVSDTYSDDFAAAIEGNDADSIREEADKLIDAGIDEETVEKKVKTALGSACNDALNDDDIGTAYEVLSTMEEYGLDEEYIKRKKRDVAVNEIAGYIREDRMDRAYADAYDYHDQYNWEVNALIERAKKIAYGV